MLSDMTATTRVSRQTRCKPRPELKSETSSGNFSPNPERIARENVISQMGIKKPRISLNPKNRHHPKGDRELSSFFISMNF